jgi:Bacteriophage head to tail connecting protein
MVEWADIEKPQAHMESQRAREEPTWRELARFLRPDGQEFTLGERRERNGYDDPYDSTPLYALDDFVGGTFIKAINPAERWCSFTIEDKKLAEYRPVKQFLWDYAGAVFSSLDPARDNFYLSAPAWFADMGGFGTGWLWQEEWVGQSQIICQPIPIGETFKDVDFAGNTNRIHRKFIRTGEQCKGMFGEAAKDFVDTREYALIHAVYPNPDFRPGNPFKRYMRFKSCYVSPDNKNFSVEGGYNELPVHELEWSKRSGRAWATGPGHNALADMRGNDEMERSALTALQFEAEPQWLVQDEDIMTAADIQPNGMIYGGINENGKEMVAPLKRGENLVLPLQKQQMVRAAIQKAFHFGLTSVLQARPQMTAQEVLSYQSDELKQLAPNLVRIYRGAGAFVGRRASLLARMGKAPVPPPEMAGQNISIEFASPFTKAQKSDTAKGVLGWVNTKVQLAESTQDPEWLDDVDKDGVSAVLHDAMTGVPEVMLDPRQVAAKRQQRSAAQAQQAQLEQATQMSEVNANNAHAAQARTLARGRVAK